MTVTILGISGSLRHDSHNTRLLGFARELLEPASELLLWAGLKEIPPFDEDDEPAPGPAVEEMRRVIASADALLIATPEYNGSLPGQLKNALDWASRPRGHAVLEHKPVATISSSPSPRGAAGAQADLRRVLARIGAELRGEPTSLPHAHQQPPQGDLRLEAALREQIRRALVDLLAAGERALRAA